MPHPDDIYTAIMRERNYQDLKYGDLQTKRHHITSWITIMRRELAEAEDAWLKKNDVEALKEILQVVAVGFACMQQHGIQERSSLEWNLLKLKDLDNAERV